MSYGAGVFDAAGGKQVAMVVAAVTNRMGPEPWHVHMRVPQTLLATLDPSWEKALARRDASRRHPPRLNATVRAH